MKKLLKVIPLVLILCVTISCQKDQASNSNPLFGAWKVIETATIDNEGQLKNSYDQSSIYLFQDDYYCIVWVQGNKPRNEFIDPWNPTNEEKIKAFDSLIVNAGMYDLEDSVIITYPIIARMPNFVGGKGFYEYKIENDTLVLTMFDELSKTGVRHTWVGKYKFQRTLIRLNRDKD